MRKLFQFQHRHAARRVEYDTSSERDLLKRMTGLKEIKKINLLEDNRIRMVQELEFPECVFFFVKFQREADSRNVTRGF